MTLTQLIESCNIPAALVRAVVKQSGGWASFKEDTKDIADHGIDGGFNGWINHSDTCAFARRNRALIAEFAADQAGDLGLGVIEMVQGFGCLGKDYSIDEIGRCLYGRGDDTSIMNGLAWYAAEECARAYCDALEAA
jgi:hypothetical protein